MTETILRVVLSELKIVRVRCQKCGTIVEVPIESLPDVPNGHQCRHCKEDICAGVGSTAFDKLLEAIKAFESTNVDVEFSIPEKRA